MSDRRCMEWVRGEGWGKEVEKGGLRKTHQKDKVRKKTGDDIKQLVGTATPHCNAAKSSFCIVMYE